MYNSLPIDSIIAITNESDSKSNEHKLLKKGAQNATNSKETRFEGVSSSSECLGKAQFFYCTFSVFLVFEFFHPCRIKQ